MGPKKPRRLNINEVWHDYRIVSQLNEEVPERPESRNVCLETCFTTFPDSYSNTVSPTDSLESKIIHQKAESHKRLLLIHKSKNVDVITKKPSLAPLAQPENFSDTSSCSSTGDNLIATTLNQDECRFSPTTPKAPQMMRRTPKIIGNLSTCTDDIRNIKSFEKLGKAGGGPLENSNSSSSMSYISAISNRTNCSNDFEHFVGMGQCSWQREQLSTSHCEIENVANSRKNSSLAEELLEEILEYAECAEFFNSGSLLEAYDDKFFDNDHATNYEVRDRLKIPKIRLSESPANNSPLILSPSSLDIDPDVISNYAIDLNLEQEHRSLLSHHNLQTSILKVGQSGRCNGSHTPPCTKTVTFSPDVLSIDDRLLLQGSCDNLHSKRERLRFWKFLPFRYFRKAKNTTASSLPNITSENVSTIYCNIERKKSIDQTLTKNEAFPLLNTAKTDNSEQLNSNVFTEKELCVDSEV